MKTMIRARWFRVEVIPTEEQEIFSTLEEAGAWCLKVRKTLATWGGEPTFRVIRVQERELLLEDGWPKQDEH